MSLAPVWQSRNFSLFFDYKHICRTNASASRRRAVEAESDADGATRRVEPGIRAKGKKGCLPRTRSYPVLEGLIHEYKAAA